MSLKEKYWELVRTIAKSINSDGCTVVLDVFVDCCYEHDIHFRFGRKIRLLSGKADGEKLTFNEANQSFKKCIQQNSWLKRWSPLAYIRYKGVSTLFGKKLWDSYRKRDAEETIN